MRIAVVGPLEVPSEQGGMSRHCEELYPRLVARGHRVTIFCRSGRPFQGVDVRPVKLVPQRGLERLHLGIVASLAGLRGFDAVHYHALVNATFCPVPRLLGRRTLVTVHRLEWQDEKWGAGARGVLRASEWAAMRTAGAVICVSETLRADLRSRYAGSDPVYVPNGVSTMPTPDPDAPARLGLTAGRYVLFVGRLVPEKGVDTLVEAFARVRDQVPDAELAVVGAPRHSEDFVASLERRDVAGVRFLGRQGGSVLSGLYRQAAAFVNPSLREGLPLTVLEAMRSACCVIASDIAEHREVLGESGVFVPVGDAAGLSKAVVRALEHPEQARAFGARAVARVAPGTAYDWERVADRTDEILRSL